MAVQAGKKTGPVMAGTKNKTPAPDEVTQIRNPGNAGYGMNGPQPSSVMPGKAVKSQLAQNLLDSVDDPAIDQVIDRGLRNGAGEDVADATGRTFAQHASTGFDGGAANDPEIRKLASGNVPTHPGTKGASAGPKVPSSLAINEGQPVRKPS